MNKALLFGLLLVGVIIGYTGAIISNGDSETINSAKVKRKAEQFVNQNLVPPNSDKKAEIKKVVEEGGLYKVSLNLSGKTIESYITKDGKTFFPQGMDIDKINSENKNDSSSQKSNQNSQRKKTVNTKKDTPLVELFVMSYCPYGTQMEKAILPAVKALGDNIDFDLQFVDYLMHSKKELNENLRQHCIEKNQPTKLNVYLSCFLESGQSEKCLSETGVDSNLLESCTEQIDNKYKITEKFNDKSTYQNGYPVFNVNKTANDKYGVSGSPTLVINGEVIKPSRTSNALLRTICSGFDQEPEECSEKLSTTPPSPGFGSGEGSNSGGSCK